MKRLQDSDPTDNTRKLSEIVGESQICFSEKGLKEIEKSSTACLDQVLIQNEKSSEFQLTEGCVLLLMEMNNFSALLALLEDDSTTDVIKLMICHYFKRYAKVGSVTIQERLDDLVTETLIRIVRKRARYMH
jgi:hypothetical protein